MLIPVRFENITDITLAVTVYYMWQPFLFCVKAAV